MGSTAIAMVGEEVRREIVQVLRGMYAYEKSSALWTSAVTAGLSGQASFLLPDELDERRELAESIAASISARLAILGASIPASAAEIASFAEVGDVTVPSDLASVGPILTYALAREREAIGRYVALEEMTRSLDVMTNRMVLKILEKKLLVEDELEGVLGSD